MKSSTFYTKPECEVLLIRQEAAFCQSYRANSIDDYNRSEFDDDDWDD